MLYAPSMQKSKTFSVCALDEQLYWNELAAIQDSGSLTWTQKAAPVVQNFCFKLVFIEKNTNWKVFFFMYWYRNINTKSINCHIKYERNIFIHHHIPLPVELILTVFLRWSFHIVSSDPNWKRFGHPSFTAFIFQMFACITWDNSLLSFHLLC